MTNTPRTDALSATVQNQNWGFRDMQILARQLETRVADLEKQLQQIYDVATGQEQVAFDDTLGMVWIAEYIAEQRKIP